MEAGGGGGATAEAGGGDGGATAEVGGGDGGATAGTDGDRAKSPAESRGGRMLPLASRRVMAAIIGVGELATGSGVRAATDERADGAAGARVMVVSAEGGGAGGATGGFVAWADRTIGGCFAWADRAIGRPIGSSADPARNFSSV